MSWNFFERQESNNFLWWNKISLISPSNRFVFFVSKGMLLCCFEGCTNPLNPVPTGITPPKTTFSFRPFNQSIRPRRAAFAKTRAVSWKLGFFDIFIGSVGTDGARTRSFRLDRAVLWPIELQSQGNTGSSRKFDSFLSPDRVFLKYKGSYIISWRIGELLGRAGFEPA